MLTMLERPQPIGPDACLRRLRRTGRMARRLHRLDDGGRWQVFDASPTPRLVLVETLTGHDDRVDQAEALAVDYAGEQTAYLAGRRETAPLPRPQVIAPAQRAA